MNRQKHSEKPKEAVENFPQTRHASILLLLGPPQRFIRVDPGAAERESRAIFKKIPHIFIDMKNTPIFFYSFAHYSAVKELGSICE
jgi:hypothetical protein